MWDIGLFTELLHSEILNLQLSGILTWMANQMSPLGAWMKYYSAHMFALRVATDV